MQLTIEVPRHHQSPSAQSVSLNLLLVQEVNPLSDGKPIYWLLLTTLPIDTFDQAWQCVVAQRFSKLERGWLNGEPGWVNVLHKMM
jgi:hypothetical protein